MKTEIFYAKQVAKFASLFQSPVATMTTGLFILLLSDLNIFHDSDNRCLKKKVLRRTGRTSWLIISLLIFSIQTQAQVLTSDRPDYAPMSTAVFTGSGFQANEQ